MLFLLDTFIVSNIIFPSPETKKRAISACRKICWPFSPASPGIKPPFSVTQEAWQQESAFASRRTWDPSSTPLAKLPNALLDHSHHIYAFVWPNFSMEPRLSRQPRRTWSRPDWSMRRQSLFATSSLSAWLTVGMGLLVFKYCVWCAPFLAFYDSPARHIMDETDVIVPEPDDPIAAQAFAALVVAMRNVGRGVLV